jgi:hypothetical protein
MGRKDGVLMRVIKIRDLHTGKVLERHGANATEILESYEPVRDEDGEIVFDENGDPLKGEKRFVLHGAEPRKWKEARAAKVAEGEPESPAEDEELTPRKGRGRKRSA